MQSYNCSVSPSAGDSALISVKFLSLLKIVQGTQNMILHNSQGITLSWIDVSNALNCFRTVYQTTRNLTTDLFQHFTVMTAAIPIANMSSGTPTPIPIQTGVKIAATNNNHHTTRQTKTAENSVFPFRFHKLVGSLSKLDNVDMWMSKQKNATTSIYHDCLTHQDIEGNSSFHQQHTRALLLALCTRSI